MRLNAYKTRGGYKICRRFGLGPGRSAESDGCEGILIDFVSVIAVAVLEHVKDCFRSEVFGASVDRRRGDKCRYRVAVSRHAFGVVV